jgi:tetratricopeptide (TPR) repeat protein
MTKISLRAYNREIESRVEKGQLDEAIAHSKHILKTYPMHIETYRLLGKAYLEARRYSDATDIFQRVIASVPDDFVAHVGMSIIRDDEGKLDQATWHMERAFEVQPSNPAIQDELRKLYGRRDGVEPPKVRLTREALANMYTQGALYGQAIVEIRAVLANDPDRPDLQVMLARAYARDGRKSQAIDLCTGLLKNYPYCFDALRILVDIMSTTDRLNIMESYRQRVCALDPYAAFASGTVFDSGKVPEDTVEIEMLDYKSGQQEGEDQPAWASSLGLSLESDPNKTPVSTQIPEVQVKEPESETISISAEGGSDQQNPDNEAIPDWMRSSGWEMTDGATPNDAENNALIPDDEQIVKADIPDWLKDMAPKEEAQTGEVRSDLQESGSEIQMGVLPGILPVENVQKDAALEKDLIQKEDEGLEIPDWLEEIKKTEPDLEDHSVPPEGLREDTGISESASEILPFSVEKMVDGPGMDLSPQEVSPGSDSKNSAIARDSSDDLIRSFPRNESEQLDEKEMRDLVPSISNERKMENSMGGTDTSDIAEPPISEGIIETDLPDWLQEVVLSTEALSQSSEMDHESSRDASISSDENTQPENIKQRTQPLEAQPGKTEQKASIEGTFEEHPPVPGELISEGENNAAFAWLEGLAVRQGARSDELLTNPEERLDVTPEVLRQTGFGKEISADNLVSLPQTDSNDFKPIPKEDQLQPDSLQSPTEIPLEEQHPIAEDETESSETFEIETNTKSEGINLKDKDHSKEGSAEILEPFAATNDDATPLEETVRIADVQGNVQVPKTTPDAVKKDGTDVSDWLKEMEAKEGISKGDLGKGIDEELLDGDESEPLPEWLSEVEKGARASEWISGVDNLLDLEKVVDDIAQNQEIPLSFEPDETLLTDKEISLDIFNMEPEDKSSITLETVDEGNVSKTIKDDQPSDSGGTPRIELIASGKLPGTGMLSKIPGINIEKGSATLEKAQQFIEKDDLIKALIEYGSLIRKGQLLEQVIHDLREITYRFPVDILIWQMLGDAFLRANRLQDALDSYTKAEELLR